MVMQEDDLTTWPTQQIKDHLQMWKDALVRYKNFNNRSGIREANRIIKEFETELTSRGVNQHHNDQSSTTNV